MTITSDDFFRLEKKVDQMADAINRLVLIEERQTTQGNRIGAVEADLAATKILVAANDKKVDQWINRGMGIWVAFAFAITVGTAIYKALV